MKIAITTAATLALAGGEAEAIQSAAIARGC